MSALASHFDRLLAYHGWAYRQLLASLASLDETRYRADRGLYFGSIHGTLNHLAVVDRIWFSRVLHLPRPFEKLDAEAAPDRAALAAVLAEGIGLWRAWLAGQDDNALAAPLEYQNMRGDAFRRRLGEILTHLVNHGTHHRGQVTAAMTAMGLESPALDFIYYQPSRP